MSVIEDGVLNARLNFTHFAVREELLTTAVQPALLRDLLRCRAALQLSFLQEVMDVLLPAFCGSDAEPLDLDKCIALRLQIKNQQTATSPSRVLNLKFVDIPPPASGKTMSGNKASETGEEKDVSFTSFFSFRLWRLEGFLLVPL